MAKKTEEAVEAREAVHTKKMIEVRVRFWTNDLASGKNRIRPKHAWSSGAVRIERNDLHGIKPRGPRPFNSLMEITGVLERVLIEHGIVLHMSPKMKKYLVAGRR